jgi:signal peptidase I
MIEPRTESNAFAELAGDLVTRGVSFRFQAKGRSMLPLIADGDILHVEPVHPSKIRVGDVILFRSEQKFKAHRVIRRYGPKFCTRGDAAIDQDIPVRLEDILGKVTAKECSSTGAVITLCGWRRRFMFFATRLRSSLRLNQNVS